MKYQMFVSTVLGLSIGMLAANSALADRGHRYHNDGYLYVNVGHEDRYEDRYEESGYGDYGRVLEARPIYQRFAVDVPHEYCDVQTVAHEERRRGGDSFAGTVVGGLVGAAIGHELGNGRGGATAVGGLIGASIGNDASKGSRTVRYHDEEVCHTRYTTEYEQTIVGYDVSYSYQGRIYQTRTDRHPGDRIPVAVAVNPRY